MVKLIFFSNLILLIPMNLTREEVLNRLYSSYIAYRVPSF